MLGGVFVMALAIAYIAQMILLGRMGRGSNNVGENRANQNPAGLEEEDSIPHARLAHFPSQIGHWRITSMMKDLKR